jgi:hypothetical protein
MFRFLFLSDARRHPLQFPARAFELALRLFLVRAIHLRQSFGEPPAGATQNGHRHLQVALECGRGRSDSRRLPLRFQKQFRLGEDALADHPRAVFPGGIELSGLARIASVLDQCGGHPRAVFRADSRDGHEILHRHLRRDRSFAHLLLDDFRQ